MYMQNVQYTSIILLYCQQTSQSFKFLFYSLDFTFPISFSSFMAAPMFPEIFNLPPMNAMVGLSLPLNMATISSESDFIETSAVWFESQVPIEPSPFFRSRYQ